MQTYTQRVTCERVEHTVVINALALGVMLVKMGQACKFHAAAGTRYHAAGHYTASLSANRMYSLLLSPGCWPLSCGLQAKGVMRHDTDDPRRAVNTLLAFEQAIGDWIVKKNQCARHLSTRK
jgi:hypothetical protein